MKREYGIRTHASLSGSNDLANRPHKPLEQFPKLEVSFYEKYSQFCE